MRKLSIILGLLVMSCAFAACAAKQTPSPSSPRYFAPPTDSKTVAESKQSSESGRQSADGSTDGSTAKAEPVPTMDTIQTKAAHWFYGPGVGKTMTNIGTVALFPPYVIYLIGNAALSLSGLQPMYMTDLLPDESRAGVLKVYNGVTSVPGRLTSSIAGREFEEE